MATKPEGTECVYTIVARSVAQKALADPEGRGDFTEHKPWVHAEKHLEDHPEDDYPLLLADASSIIGVEWIANIDSIELTAQGTHVTFSGVTSVDRDFPLDALIKVSDGKPLNPKYIRPYLPCFVRGEFERYVHDALHWDEAAEELDSKGVDDFFEALTALEPQMTKHERQMLTAHAAAPDHSMSMGALARSIGYPNWRDAGKEYVALGKKVVELLHIQNQQLGLDALVDLMVEKDDHSQSVMTMREPLFQALRALGWVKQEGTSDLQTQAAAAEVNADPQCKDLSSTEREAMVKARIGQGAYRAGLEKIWAGSCALTGCALRDVLVASHAKAWSESSNAERCDPFNGLLLAAHVDALFDRGLIGFDDDGKLLLKPQVTPPVLASLGLTGANRLRFVRAQHVPYLRAHRIHFGFTENGAEAAEAAEAVPA